MTPNVIWAAGIGIILVVVTKPAPGPLLSNAGYVVYTISLNCWKSEGPIGLRTLHIDVTNEHRDIYNPHTSLRHFLRCWWVKQGTVGRHRSLTSHRRAHIPPISVPVLASMSAMQIQSGPETSLAHNTYSPLLPSLHHPIVQVSPDLGFFRFLRPFPSVGDPPERTFLVSRLEPSPSSPFITFDVTVTPTGCFNLTTPISTANRTRFQQTNTPATAWDSPFQSLPSQTKGESSFRGKPSSNGVDRSVGWSANRLAVRLNHFWRSGM